MKPIFLNLFLSIFSLSLFGQQYGNELLDTSKLKDWEVKWKRDYTGVYHFGFSEGESELVFIYHLSKAYAQLRYGSFTQDGKDWIWTYKNFTNVRVEGNRFYSDQSNGKFLVYGSGSEEIKGLKIDTPWLWMEGEGLWEFGERNGNVDQHFEGEYPEASYRLMSIQELREYSKPILKIMRNEIFARYEYKFIEAGAMDLHFRKQTWYKARHKDVNHMLSDLEKTNIKNIRKVEAEE